MSGIPHQNEEWQDEEEASACRVFVASQTVPWSGALDCGMRLSVGAGRAALGCHQHHSWGETGKGRKGAQRQQSRGNWHLACH